MVLQRWCSHDIVSTMAIPQWCNAYIHLAYCCASPNACLNWPFITWYFRWLNDSLLILPLVHHGFVIDFVRINTDYSFNCRAGLPIPLVQWRKQWLNSANGTAPARIPFPSQTWGNFYSMTHTVMYYRLVTCLQSRELLLVYVCTKTMQFMLQYVYICTYTEHVHHMYMDILTYIRTQLQCRKSPVIPLPLLIGIPPALLPPAGSPAKLHSPSDRRLQRHSPIKTDIPVVKRYVRMCLRTGIEWHTKFTPA